MNVLCKLLNVMPVAPGAAGVPMPSSQLSFCIQEMPKAPAAGELKIGLFAFPDVSRRLIDSMLHCPAPNCASNALTAPPRLNCNTACCSPISSPGADTEIDPAPP